MIYLGSFAFLVAIIAVVACINGTLEQIVILSHQAIDTDDRVRDIELRLGKLELRDAAVSDPWTEDLN